MPRSKLDTRERKVGAQRFRGKDKGGIGWWRSADRAAVHLDDDKVTATGRWQADVVCSALIFIFIISYFSAAAASLTKVVSCTRHYRIWTRVVHILLVTAFQNSLGHSVSISALIPARWVARLALIKGILIISWCAAAFTQHFCVNVTRDMTCKFQMTRRRDKAKNVHMSLHIDMAKPPRSKVKGDFARWRIYIFCLSVRSINSEATITNKKTYWWNQILIETVFWNLN